MSYSPPTRAFVPVSFAGSPTSGNWNEGQAIIDTNDVLWVCTVAGSPGTWQQIASSATDVSSVFGRTGVIVAANGDYTVSQVSGAAPLASPALTGTPTAPTAAAGTSTTQIATTAFVASSYAPLASPALTGTPTAPTASAGTNTTQLATTAFVQAAITAVQAALYPVGAIFLSAVNTNPATLLGFGTWSAIGQGRVLMGVGTGTDIDSNTLTVAEGSAGDTIGEYKHTLSGTESGTAAHSHGITDPTHAHNSPDNNGFYTSRNTYSFSGGSGYSFSDSSASTAASATGITINNAASTAAANAHNNVMPYFGVYAWQRTA